MLRLDTVPKTSTQGEQKRESEIYGQLESSLTPFKSGRCDPNNSCVNGGWLPPSLTRCPWRRIGNANALLQALTPQPCSLKHTAHGTSKQTPAICEKASPICNVPLVAGALSGPAEECNKKFHE